MVFQIHEQNRSSTRSPENMNKRSFIMSIAVLLVLWPIGTITPHAQNEYDLPKYGSGGKGGCIADCKMFQDLDKDPDAYKQCVEDCKNTDNGPPPMI